MEVSLDIFADNVKGSVEFYQNVFNRKAEWYNDSYAVLTTEKGFRFAFFDRKAAIKSISSDLTYPAGLNGSIKIGLDYPTFSDVDKEYDRLLSFGAKSVGKPTTEPWGQRSCFIADPEGNLIELTSSGQNV